MLTNTTPLLHKVRSLLESNQVRSGDYRYTRPAPSIYEQQWLWDSCFHALIYRHFDPEMAKDELRSLLYHRGVETEGMIPHMIYWQGGGQALWGQDYVSFLTQPPMLAQTALAIYHTCGDRLFLSEIYDRLAAHYRWLWRARDPDGDGLLSLIHPWESGWDASPRWDEALGLDRPNDDELKQARFQLAHRLKQVGPDMAAVASAGLFQVEPVDFNAIYAANLDTLAEVAAILGQPDEQNYFAAIAHQVKAAINAKMWDETAGFYWDLAGPSEQPVKIATPAAFITLSAQIPTPQQAERLVGHLSSRFWPAYPIPTVAVDQPGFAPDRYWRGSVWLNLNWFMVRGLRAYGYTKLAWAIIHQGLELIEKEGFREYYHPLTGRGLGAQAQSWSGIILDMAVEADLQ